VKIQVVVTRTDAGATTKLMSNRGESSKNYASWDDALKEAEHLKLINTVRRCWSLWAAEMNALTFSVSGTTTGRCQILKARDRVGGG
jgi:hypothetical protein